MNDDDKAWNRLPYYILIAWIMAPFRWLHCKIFRR